MRSNNMLATKNFYVDDTTGELNFLLRSFNKVDRKLFDRLCEIKDIFMEHFGSFMTTEGEHGKCIYTYPGTHYNLDRVKYYTNFCNGLYIDNLEVLNTRKSFTKFLWKKVSSSMSPENIFFNVDDASNVTLYGLLINDTLYREFVDFWSMY